MSDETIILEKTSIQYIFAATEPVDKGNKWEQGHLTITDKKIMFSSAGKQGPASIAHADIIEVDKKIQLGKLALGAPRVLPIHHTLQGKTVISLISTSKENATTFKKIIFNGVFSGSNIEFVSPFSRAGKILLDKQPARGILNVNENILQLTSEWLGKKQTETIDLIKINDFDISSSNPGTTSITLKYQKDGVVISTLITGENKVISSFGEFIKIIKGMSEEDEEIKLNEQQYMLLQMMYTTDIDTQMATEMLGVSPGDLKTLVNELVRYKILRVSGDEEVELTEKGTKYIVEYMKKNIGGA